MTYRTIDIKLGAVLLGEVLGAHLKAISDIVINSKRVIEIEYPEDQTDALNKIVKDYGRKIQLANVYHYNRSLCIIRDALRKSGVKYGERMRTREIFNGKRAQ